MRKKLLIGLAVYLVLGVAFGLTTERHKYMCPPSSERVLSADDARELRDRGYVLFGATTDDRLVEVDSICFPIFSTADRLEWVAITTPAWLPLAVRKVVRGEGIAIGNVIVGNRNWDDAL